MNATPQQSLAPYAPHLQRAVGAPRAATRMPQAERGTIQELVEVLLRRWRVIAGTVLVLVGMTFAYCQLTTRWYQGQSMILIEPRALQVLSSSSQVGAQDALTSTKYDYYQTQFSLLQSPTLAKRVISELNLANDPRFLVPAFGPSPATPPTMQQMVGKYLSQLTVLPVRGTRLVSLQFLSTDPKLAADVANAHAKAFVSTGLERLYAATEQVRDFLQSKLTELQARRQDAEVKLLKFQSDHDMLPVDVTKDVESERFMELNRRLTAAESERIALEAQVKVIQKNDFDSVPSVLTNPLIQKLREDTDRLEVEYALLAQKFRPTYPRLRQVSGQLAHARDLLRQETAKVVGSVQANYDTAQATVDKLKSELDSQREALLGRKDAEGEFLTLVRDVETTRALYDNLLARLKDLSIAGSADASNISLAEPALPPQLPAIPRTKLYLLLSIATSLVLGTGLAFLRDSWDRTVRDGQDVERLTGLGTLAVVPDFDKPLIGTVPNRVKRTVARSRRSALVAWRKIGQRAFGMEAAEDHTTRPLLLGNGNMPPRAEPYRTLRTALLLSPETTPQAILVTSAAGSEGKTTTAINVAASLARCGASVLLIDGDLRLPRCHQALDVPVEPGLSEFLAGQLPTEPIVPTRIENLSFLPAGGPVGNPAELLTSAPMSALLRQVRERFNFIVIDSPPLLAVSDGYVLGNMADGVVLVVERGRSRHDRVRMALQRLYETGAQPIGVVLNRGGIEREYYGYRRMVKKTGPRKPVRAAGPEAPATEAV